MEDRVTGDVFIGVGAEDDADGGVVAFAALEFVAYMRDIKELCKLAGIP